MQGENAGESGNHAVILEREKKDFWGRNRTEENKKEEIQIHRHKTSIYQGARNLRAVGFKFACTFAQRFAHGQLSEKIIHSTLICKFYKLDNFLRIGGSKFNRIIPIRWKMLIQFCVLNENKCDADFRRLQHFFLGRGISYFLSMVKILIFWKFYNERG